MHIFPKILSVAKKVALFALVVGALAFVARLEPGRFETGLSQVAVINLIEVTDASSADESQLPFGL